MSRSAAVATALALATLATPAHTGELTKTTQEVSLPRKGWSLLVDLAGFESERAGTRPDGSVALLEASNRSTGVSASVFLESRPDLNSAAACKHDYWAKASRSPLPKSEMSHARERSLETVHWTLGKPGDALTQRHVNAYLYRDGVCIDVHLSKFPWSPGDERVFTAVLGSLRFSDEAPAALAPSAEAKAAFDQGMAAYGRRDFAAAEKHFRAAAAQVARSYTVQAYLGHSLFYQDRFPEAVAAYATARALGAPAGRQQQTLVRALNDQLGMALARAGRLEQAKAHFRAAIREDPGYPMSYYNLACIHAELGDMDGALANLELAYARRKGMLAGEKLPNARTDAPFQRFVGELRFQAALQRLGL